MFSAIQTAPNVGYVNAINASSISLAIIASTILFKDELILRKMIGVVRVAILLSLPFWLLAIILP